MLLGETGSRLGRSPRGRGSLAVDRRQPDFPGSIPAWAGEPGIPAVRVTRPGVDPRVGGGAPKNPASLRRHSGRSPRGRGSPAIKAPRRAAAGSIPAWAGEPDLNHQRRIRRRVDPRVGGGAPDLVSRPGGRQGRSPRGRGSRRDRMRRPWLGWSIPAWAGEPSRINCATVMKTVDPRVGGGAVVRSRTGRAGGGRSPRGRGSPSAKVKPAAASGSIPAWAGEPPRTKMMHI